MMQMKVLNQYTSYDKNVDLKVKLVKHNKCKCSINIHIKLYNYKNYL